MRAPRDRLRHLYRRHLETLLPRLWQAWRGSRWKGQRRPGLGLLHVGRCGSTVVGDMLARTPGICWDDEPLNPGLARRLPRRLCGLAEPSLASVRRAHHQAGADLYGGAFLILQLRRAGHPDVPSALAALEEHGVGSFVVLERRNLLRVSISHLVAQVRDRWHLVGDDAAPKPQRVRVEVAAGEGSGAPSAHSLPGGSPLPDFLEDLAGFYRGLRRALASQTHLWLVYEDDVAEDPGQAYGKICEFAGLEPRAVAPRHRRITPQPLCELVENWDEVCAALAGTDFAWMLESDT